MPVLQPGVLGISQIIHGEDNMVAPGFLQRVPNRLSDPTTQDGAHGLVQEHVFEIAADPDCPRVVSQIALGNLRHSSGAREGMGLYKIYLHSLRCDYFWAVGSKIGWEPTEQKGLPLNHGVRAVHP